MTNLPFPFECGMDGTGLPAERRSLVSHHQGSAMHLEFSKVGSNLVSSLGDAFIRGEIDIEG